MNWGKQHGLGNYRTQALWHHSQSDKQDSQQLRGE